MKKPANFNKFLFIGGIGTLIIFGITWLLAGIFNMVSGASLVIAIIATIDICYLMSNHWDFIKILPKRIIGFVKYFFTQYKEVIKFGLVGIIGTSINLLLLYILTSKVGINYIISAAISAACATVVNYTINHYWTFQKTKIKDNWFVGWLRYKLVDDMTILIYLGELALFVEVFGFWYIAGAITATIINYPIRYFVLKRFIWEIRKYNQNSPSYEWDAFYNGSITQMWWKREIANTVWKWIPSSLKLLDVGCGSSPIITHYNNAIGIDRNNGKLDFMRERCSGNTFEKKELSHYDKETFDHIICIEVLEHLENPALVVKEISRVLKVGGKVVIATPDYSKPMWRMAELFTPYKDDHHNNFTMDKLDRLCEKYNLMPTIYKYVAGCDLVEMFVKGDKFNE